MAQFKTRARALDLLGRQQIAGIPTAINELIKNAYDAYADHFDASLIRNKNMLVLRDDGMGMTRDEFENRWLVLGTESKFVSSLQPPRDPSKEYRPVSGEKGIGRLAIASIGKQVLILTKSKSEDNAKIIAALINWEIFEIPGINMEDVVIPICEYDGFPSLADIEKLKTEAITPLRDLAKQGKISQQSCDTICGTLQAFSLDAKTLYRQISGPFNLDKEDCGTQFYVSPVDNILYSDLLKESGQNELTKMEKMLLGFHNTMIPEHQNPAVDISFRDFRNEDGSFTSIIDKESFFTPEEFELADHHIKGEFDKYGQFKGQITIYGDKTYDYSLSWRENNFRELSCGPFSIDIAYIQGEEKASRMSNRDYIRVKDKTNRMGGLYIYRNNIRVLPYGDSDYDFIDIEKNRSKRFGSFFSYRRMLGTIEIQGLEESELREKAGREGFIENSAYRQFQSVLKNFFFQLQQDIFSDQADSIQSEFFQEKKTEFERAHKILENQSKKAKAKKDKFLKQLDDFFNKLENHIFEQELNDIGDQLAMELDIIPYIEDPDAASQKIVDLENETRKKLVDYKKTIAVPFPKGFVISKASRSDYDVYCKNYHDLCNGVIANTESRIDALIADCITRLNIEISKRKRLVQAVDLITEEALSLNKKKKEETIDVVKSVSEHIKEITNQLMLDLDGQIRGVKDQMNTLATQQADTFDLVKERKRLGEEIDSISNRNTEVMDRIIRQFTSFYVEKEENGDIVTNDQIVDTMSEELEDLRTRLQSDIELSQLGLAVGIIHHEFNGTINSIRHSIRDLKAWSDMHEDLDSIYKNIKINFEHLDNYMNLFTPLNRRLYRNKEEIPLLDVNSFLLDLFKSRLERHNVQLKHTKGFAQGKLFGFRSTFYPVFVNIVDNAIYWLSHSEIPEKIIRLHADEAGNVFISNNGPAIKETDKKRIFELRYSKKPNGRGLGLSISKEVLNDENYDLKLDTPREGSTVTFRIFKLQ